MPTLESKRLILRSVTKGDYAYLLAMGQDPRVMEFLGPLQTENEVHAFINKIQEHERTHRFSYLTITEKESEEFIGLVGLLVPSYDLPFSPCVEIGWRLRFSFWNKGYAFEAAQRLLDFGFQEFKLKEIVSFTATINKRSENLMKRLGMKKVVDGNFMHPKVAEGNPLREHVLYKIGPP